MNAALQLIRGRLHNLDRAPRLSSKGNALTARCPVGGHGQGHGDRHPSLSICEVSDGTILIACFAGCSTADVVAALGLDLRDLFPSAGNQAYQRRPKAVVVSRLPSSWRDPAWMTALQARYAQAVSPSRLAYLAHQLGLSGASLLDLGIGWSADHRAWTFPMRSGRGDLVGFRLRFAGGRKLTVKGTHEGIFIPASLQRGGRLLVAEGPTDAAALLDLGLPAIGRPSCMGGVEHIVRLVRRMGVADVVIVADRDAPGQRGATRLTEALVPYALVRVITPPAKDVREWCMRHHAIVSDVTALIEQALVHRLSVVVCRGVAGSRHD